MFGYVLPVKCKLSEADFARYQGAYCGLCHSLKEHFGFRARFVLNYDFTFLAMLLSHAEGEVKKTDKACLARLFRKRSCYVAAEPYKRAAGYSVILTWWKLQDVVQDDGRVKALISRLLSLWLHSAYKKAKRDFTEFDAHCRTNLAKLRTLEVANSAMLDEVADSFATLLAAAAAHIENLGEKRAYSALFYHTGRLIYLLDAYDDLAEDTASGNYNVLSQRYVLEDGKLTAEDEERLSLTMQHSIHLAIAAYHLLPQGSFAGVLENIMYDGLLNVKKQVLGGTFTRKKQKEKAIK